MSKLTALAIAECDIADIVADKRLLEDIKELHLSNGLIDKIPEVVFDMKGLINLHIIYGKIRDIPNEISRLTNLKKLILYSIRISALDEDKGERNIAEMSNSDRILNNILQLKSLEVLNLNHTGLSLEKKRDLRLKRLKHLFIQGCNLKALPDFLFFPSTARWMKNTDGELLVKRRLVECLPSLETLDVSCNMIEDLAENIALAVLSPIRKFFAAKNNFTKIPRCIKGLKYSLEFLDLSRNSIGAISEDLLDLKLLEELDLSDNKIREIPSNIQKLSSLRRLILNNNSISSIPEGLWSLKKLQVLGLSDNQISMVSNRIGNLPELYLLRLSRNKITLIPDGLKNHGSLVEIYLDSNDIRFLPQWLIYSNACLPKIRSFNITSNSFSDDYKKKARSFSWVDFD